MESIAIRNETREPLCNCKTNRSYIFLLTYTILLILFSEIFLSLFVYNLRNELSNDNKFYQEKYELILKELAVLKSKLHKKEEGIEDSWDDYRTDDFRKKRRIREVDKVDHNWICEAINKNCVSQLLVKGARGPPGNKGESGRPGPVGPPGKPGKNYGQGKSNGSSLVGPPGLPGRPGIPGPKGEAGFPGIPGMDGEKGDLGLVGPPGIPGEKGNPGFAGITGQLGLPGVKGNPGFDGIPGPPGLRGPKGNPGIIGPPGAVGLAESNCMCKMKDDAQPNDERKTKFNEPDTVQFGAPTPITAQSSYSMQRLQRSSTDQFQFQLPTLNQNCVCKGILGPKGEPGQKGEPGSKGEKGPKGVTGLKGEPGIKGSKGERGFKGEREENYREDTQGRSGTGFIPIK